MPTDIDPFISFQFGLDIPDISDAGYFTEVSGLEFKIPATKSLVVTKDGKRILRQIPGDGVEYGDIVLKRGMTANMALWKWRVMVEEGKIDEARKNGSIVMYNMAGVEIARWSFTNGWPSKLTGPSLTSDSDDVAIEELTIVHEGLTRDL